MTYFASKNPPSSKGPRVNQEIVSPQVRLVDAEGAMIGIVSIEEALKRSQEVFLDLVEIVPNTDPPVCKIQNYGKLKYEDQKKRAELKKKQKTIELKEIQIRPTIEIHDYEVKRKKAHSFLLEGNKVKVTLQFRGREMSHQELGVKMIQRFQKDLEDVSKIDMEPKLEGRRMIMVLSPEKTN